MIKCKKRILIHSRLYFEGHLLKTERGYIMKQLKSLLMIMMLILVVTGCTSTGESQPIERAVPNDQGRVSQKEEAFGSAEKIEVIAERSVENKAFRNIKTTGLKGKYTITGEGRVFEATMNYAVSDGHNYLVEDFLTLDMGAPQWSAFTLDIHIPEEKLPHNGTLILELFEYSAEDGSVSNSLNIPLESFR